MGIDDLVNVSLWRPVTTTDHSKAGHRLRGNTAGGTGQLPTTHKRCSSRNFPDKIKFFTGQGNLFSLFASVL